MWKYVQTSGRLYHDDVPKGTGYAGNGAGKNNPAMQNVHNIGPLPIGMYTIEQAYTHPKLGPITMNLTPDPENEMYGRSAFRMHGDSIDEPGTASEGCIVQNRDVRLRVSLSTDRQLKVIPEETV